MVNGFQVLKQTISARVCFLAGAYKVWQGQAKNICWTGSFTLVSTLC